MGIETKTKLEVTDLTNGISHIHMLELFYNGTRQKVNRDEYVMVETRSLLPKGPGEEYSYNVEKAYRNNKNNAKEEKLIIGSTQIVAKRVVVCGDYQSDQEIESRRQAMRDAYSERQ